MAGINLTLPSITMEDLQDDAKLQKILSYLYQLNEQLRYELTHIDDDNISREGISEASLTSSVARTLTGQLGEADLILSPERFRIELKQAMDNVDELHNTAVDIDYNGVTFNTTGEIKAVVDDEEQLIIDEEGVSARRIIAKESLTAPNVVNKHLTAEIPWRGGVQASLDGVANHLTQDTTLTIPSGTFYEDVSIRGFVGAKLTLLFSEGAKIIGTVTVSDCSRVTLEAATLGDGCIYTSEAKETVTNDGSCLTLRNLYVSGFRRRLTATDGSKCAVLVQGGCCHIEGCGLEYADYGALFTDGATGFVQNTRGGQSGADPLLNCNLLYGLYAMNGAHVAATGTVPMGGTSATGQTLATLLSGTITPTAGGMEYVPPSEVTKTFALTSQCTYRQNKSIGSDLRQGLYGEYTTKGWGIASMWFAEATKTLKDRQILSATLTLRRAVGGSSAPVNAYFGTVPMTAENYDSTTWPAFTKCDSLYPGEKIAREGEMTYDVTELMPKVQQGHALALHEPIKSYTDDHSPAYAIFYGLNSGYAPVLTVTYVPGASEPPVPDEPESVTVQATAAYERGGNGATTNDFRALKKGSGYAAVTFPANAALAECQKLTLHFYIVSGYSAFNTIALKTGTTKDGAFGVDTSIATPVPTYTPTANGWQSVDVTSALDADSGVTRAEAAANGIKVFLRSASSSTVGGVSGENCPYFTIE